MKNITATTLAVAIALSGGLTLLPASPAFAQSNSKLCGYTAVTPTGTIGLLYEGYTPNSSYMKQCDLAVARIWKKIQNDPQLSQLTWTKQYNKRCEEVGVNFVTAQTNSDICDMMASKLYWQVTKTTSTDTTTVVQTYPPE